MQLTKGDSAMYKQSQSILVTLIIQFIGLLFFKTPIAKVIGWSLWAVQLVLLIFTIKREREEELCT